MPAYRVIVAGRVQGVFFRRSTLEQALASGVTGWVRNDPAGTVTVHIQHEDEQRLQALLTWLRKGPPGAVVERLTAEAVPAEAGLTDFEVRAQTPVTEKQKGRQRPPFAMPGI